ncbi:hypothetical protein AGABI1DRAFT_129687 [Agaricus bisporus var. burnettii JB137-S8]|uniref:Major facilitator superfamily (MFS) profile domain-containing protein n=1 Tax=Agaricus bisporus var. burnettii (strain JB137-S8 / ATCC MYA-4627 / FGSC 10392) TaxID=597362 RepID=K5VTV2_AGABU|nr:uncharacterized protein AGABI1DRAFT_129687 [Agaricus bisporus var. burnettii JB137-S8]EKM77894.1 hypothetical protein AGABI1DRAFT_129687 [Agaricus bisporus var. burnettii JB137-S8]
MAFGVDCFLSLAFVTPPSCRSVFAANALTSGVVYDVCLREGGGRNVEGEGVCKDIGRLEVDLFNPSLSDSSSRIFPLLGKPLDRNHYETMTRIPSLYVAFMSLRLRCVSDSQARPCPERPRRGPSIYTGMNSTTTDMDKELEKMESEMSRPPSQASKLSPSPLPSDTDDLKPQRSTIKAITMVLVMTLMMFVNTGNTTSVSITLPAIGREFQADPSLLQWIMAAYPLSSGCLLLVCGRLADLYGRKKAYLIGTTLLAAFTLSCGFANNVLTLIILRGFQGIGAAATIPASLGILADSFPPGRSRSLAFATFAAGAPIGAAFGSAAGGALTEQTSKTWRSSFYLFAAVNVLCFIGGLLSIDNGRKWKYEDNDAAGARRVDWLGAFLISAALVLILFVLGEGETAQKQWATSYIIALLVVGVLLVGVFIWWQWYLEKVQNHRPQEGNGTWNNRLPPPLMKLSLWARAKGRFAAVIAIVFLTWSSYMAWTFWVQLYFQNYVGLTPLQTVVRLFPLFVAGTLCDAFVGIMANHVSMIVITTMGTLGTSIACLLFAIVDPKVTYWAYCFPAVVLSVMGVELVYTAGTLYIAKISLPHEQSLAGALFQTMAQIGTSAGITISTVIFNRITSNLAEGEDQLRSYRAAQWTCCAFGLTSMVLSLIVFRGVGVPGQKKSITINPAERAIEEKAGGEV